MNGLKVMRWWRTLRRSRWYLGLSMVSPGLQYVLLDAGHHPEIVSLVTSGELSWPVPTTTHHVHPVQDWEQWLQPMLQRLSITNPSTGLQICCAIDGTLSWQKGVTPVPLQKRCTWLKRQASSALGVAAQHCSVDYLELERVSYHYLLGARPTPPWLGNYWNICYCILATPPSCSLIVICMHFMVSGPGVLLNI